MFDIEEFSLKTVPYVVTGKHAHDCLDLEGGPCTCGLEEVLEDEALESAPEES
jgi:hypothetical protein